PGRRTWCRSTSAAAACGTTWPGPGRWRRPRPPGSSRRSRGRSTTPTSRASCTATSSRATCCCRVVRWRGRGVVKTPPPTAPPPPRDLTTPKITDFGLARLSDAEVQQTATGDVLGTPAYMSPEQAAGLVRLVDPRSDVYALGAILFECLTGEPPFRGSSRLEVLDRVRNQDPEPPSKLAPVVPRDLDVICLKCLRKDPARRYATADELADDL